MWTRHFSWIAILVVFSTAAEASVTLATRGVFTGRASVSGKLANHNYEVFVSTGLAGPGGNKYQDTGFRIDTDASGNGTVSITNTTGGTLQLGHNVKVGDNGHENNQPPQVVVSTGTAYWPGNWWAT